jgi:hypothetical protein
VTVSVAVQKSQSHRLTTCPSISPAYDLARIPPVKLSNARDGEEGRLYRSSPYMHEQRSVIELCTYICTTVSHTCLGRTFKSLQLSASLACWRILHRWTWMCCFSAHLYRNTGAFHIQIGSQGGWGKLSRIPCLQTKVCPKTKMPLALPQGQGSDRCFSFNDVQMK